MDALFRQPLPLSGTTRRLRLCIVTETYPPEINGVARTLQRLVQGLSEGGHQVRVVRPRQGSDQTNDAATTLVNGVRMPLYRDLQLGLPARSTLRRLWSDQRPHAVYIATEGPLGYAALKEARIQGIPILAGFHTNFHTYSRHYGLGPLTPMVLRYLRWFHNRAACTLAPAPEAVAYLRKHGFRDVEQLGRGVDARLFAPEKRDGALRREWGLEENDPAVIYVGRVAAEKNLDLAVDAFRAIQAEQGGARFVLVGDGPLRPKLARHNPDFLFCGMQTGEALARHYASADLLLFPSLTETYGNVVPEAMASALAVVAYDCAAAHMHIRHGINGWVAPVGDAEAYLATATAAAREPVRLRALGAAARNTALTLDWNAVVNRFEDLVHDYGDVDDPDDESD